MDEKPERLTDHKEPVLCWISPAQRDMLKWFRERLPWGHAEITTRDGEPKGAKIMDETAGFGR